MDYLQGSVLDYSDPTEPVADDDWNATARYLACPLITADSKLLTYPHVDTVW